MPSPKGPEPAALAFTPTCWPKGELVAAAGGAFPGPQVEVHSTRVALLVLTFDKDKE